MPFSKRDLFTHVGTYEDFKERSNRFYAQLAVDTHGAAVRDNSIPELIRIGKELDGMAECVSCDKFTYLRYGDTCSRRCEKELRHCGILLHYLQDDPNCIYEHPKSALKHFEKR